MNCSFYPVPETVGIDERIMPTVGLSKNLCVFTISQDHALRLLKESKPKSEGLLSRYADKPLASATHFNFAGLVDVVMPWVEYGMNQQALAEAADDAVEGDEDEGDALDPMVIRQRMMAASELLKCLRGVSSVTFVDKQSLVTHYEWHFQDMK